MAVPIKSRSRRSQRLSSVRYFGHLSPLTRLALDNMMLRRELDTLKVKFCEIEERLSMQKVVVLRNISKEEAKEEVSRLFTNGRTLYYSDIAEELGLSLQMVVEICRELQGNGVIGVDEEALAGTR